MYLSGTLTFWFGQMRFILVLLRQKYAAIQEVITRAAYPQAY